MSRQSCPHLQHVIQNVNASDLCLKTKGSLCCQCSENGPNLWICLQKKCLFIGCSDKHNDHSTQHFETNRTHCIQMNLSSQRVWCYLCESEVFLQSQHNRYHQRANSLDSNDSARRIFQYNHEFHNEKGGEASSLHRGYDSEIDDEEIDYQGQLNGLVGLKNIANTCYMNSAIQALSNSPPLTGYFLECGNIIQNSTSRTKVGLAKSYYRLIRDMWLNKRRGYIVPDEIIRGISTIHPIFRGYQQHDTQEFLRCFMDQLHEELKEVTPPPPDSISIDEEMNSLCSSPSPSQSEAEEYETCDSGVSEQSSLSDEIQTTSRTRMTKSRSPSPLRSASSVPTLGSSILTNRTGSNASLTSVHSNSTSANTQQQQQQSKDSPSSKQQQQQQQPQQPKVIHRSIISDIFDGKLLSSVQCLTCDRVSTREETFQDLSLPIPGRDYLTMLHQAQNPIGMPFNPLSAPVCASNNGSQNTTQQSCTDVVYQVQDTWMWWLWNWFRSFFYGPAVTLHDCMNAFFSADELKGDNMYSCEKCNKLRNGVKFSRVLALPEMLCVHLKRFRHDLSYSSKISSPVIFPLAGLDMRQYLHKDCKSKVSTYDLTAIICHHGTVGSGHYICYAKHAPTDKWYEFDDQTVTQVSAETVQNCEAYVLFYQKTNPQMANLRAQAQEIINSKPFTSSNPSDIKFFISRQWLNRFNTMSEPGPIDNWSILCQHGNLLPNKAANLSDLLIPLPQSLWDFFYAEFGGGPVTNHPIECDTCKTRAEDLERRQKNELLIFSELRDEFQYQDHSSMLFAISMAWFRKWQAFARCEASEEPGPINNTTIAFQSDSLIIRNVRPGSDYAQINFKLWKFFFDIYGGGPAIVLRGAYEFSKVEKESDLADTTENLSLNDNDESNDCLEELHSDENSNNIINNDEEHNDEDVDDEFNEELQPDVKDESKTKNILKPAKTVSFEDTKDLSESEDENNSASIISVPKNLDENGMKYLTMTTNDVNRINSNNINSKKTKKPKPMPTIKNYDPIREKKRREINNGLFGAEGSIRYIPDGDGNTDVEMKAINHQKPKRNGMDSSSEDEEVAGLTMNSENEKIQQQNHHHHQHPQRYNKKKSKSLRVK